jgi:hypothetical protein
MSVTFPPVEAYDFDKDAANFPADVNGTRLICRISREALEDRFNSIGEDILDCFRENRTAIEVKARALIEKNRLESDGSILIRSNDI